MIDGGNIRGLIEMLRRYLFGEAGKNRSRAEASTSRIGVGTKSLYCPERRLLI
jgi:hypothetical protein